MVHKILEDIKIVLEIITLVVALLTLRKKDNNKNG